MPKHPNYGECQNMHYYNILYWLYIYIYCTIVMYLTYHAFLYTKRTRTRALIIIMHCYCSVWLCVKIIWMWQKIISHGGNIIFSRYISTVRILDIIYCNKWIHYHHRGCSSSIIICIICYYYYYFSQFH